MKKAILTKDAPAPIGPYSQAIFTGNLLFCSGQIALDPATNQVVTGGVEEQTQQVMKNIEAVLSANDMTWDHVVKTTIFLTDMNDFARVNEIYSRSFSSQPPARSTVAVFALPKSVKVEIEVVAAR